MTIVTAGQPSRPIDVISFIEMPKAPSPAKPTTGVSGAADLRPDDRGEAIAAAISRAPLWTLPDDTRKTERSSTAALIERGSIHVEAGKPTSINFEALQPPPAQPPRQRLSCGPRRRRYARKPRTIQDFRRTTDR